MSAIFGAWRLDNRPLDHAELEPMSALLAHRGRDNAAIWISGSVGLGHRMQWTTPESLTEQLPVRRANADLTITADARIDNRAELIEALGLHSQMAATIGDGALILAAYERWGESCIKRLLGDFAFVIWDGRRRRLFGARDPMGVKPFFYHTSRRMFAFASEIKALLALPDTPRQINELRIGDILAGNSEDLASTIYRDIERLPPAHCFSISIANTRITMHRFWELNPEHKLHLGSNAEYAEALRELFVEAVRRRTRSAFAVGSTLSGGLDSSSIACVARDIVSAQGIGSLPTFSAIFPGLPSSDLPWIDERAFVDAVLATNGFAPYAIAADEVSPLVDLDRMLWHQDEPFFAPNMYIHWAIYAAAQRAGVSVLLDGIDGDSTISHGWEYLVELARAGGWMRLVHEGIGASRLRGRSPLWYIWHMGFQPLLPMWTTNMWQRNDPLESSWLLGSAINRTFARRIGLADRTRTLREPASRPARNAQEFHSRSISSPLLTDVLDLTDKAAAAFGIEPRYPFMDQRLIEFCVALPAAQKMQRGIDRIVMRRAMKNILPEQLVGRIVKANLGYSFERGLREREHERIAQVALHHPDAVAPYLDPSALRAAYERYTSPTSVTSPDSQDSFVLYSAVILDRWLQLNDTAVLPIIKQPLPIQSHAS